MLYWYTGIQRFYNCLFHFLEYTGIFVYRDFLPAYSISDGIRVYRYIGIQRFSETNYSISDVIRVYRYIGIQRFSEANYSISDGIRVYWYTEASFSLT